MVGRTCELEESEDDPVLLVLRQELEAVAQQIGRTSTVSLQELGEVVVPEQRIDLSGEMAAPFRLEPRVVLQHIEALAHTPELVLQCADADRAAKEIEQLPHQGAPRRKGSPSSSSW